MAEENNEIVEETKKEKNTKEDLKKKQKAFNKKVGGLIGEFKKFISKGNVVDMAIGVVVGAAFSAIINALVDGIIMPLITLAIPSGGIDGIVTVLNHDAAVRTVDTIPSNVISYWGVEYDKTIVNVINWGSFINAVIYFLIVALILFTVMKVYTTLKKQSEGVYSRSLEKYYKKHPEERPIPKVEEKKPTEVELLQQILDELKSKEK